MEYTTLSTIIAQVWAIPCSVIIKLYIHTRANFNAENLFNLLNIKWNQCNFYNFIINYA